MAPHSSTFAQKIPWAEELARLQSMRSLESDTTKLLHFSLSCIGEGNGNPLQCFCLENPRDRETWQAAIYGVAQSWTRLKRLSSVAVVLINSYLQSAHEGLLQPFQPLSFTHGETVAQRHSATHPHLHGVLVTNLGTQVRLQLPCPKFAFRITSVPIDSSLILLWL